MRKCFLLFIITLSLTLVAENVPPACAEENDSDEFLLEEITVTALKRSTNVQKTAISTTAFSGEYIREEGKYRLDELLMDVPGLQVQNDPQGAKFVVRGVSENLHSSADFPTATYADGVYLASPAESRAGFYDMERIEVLRGPQGTLFGMNSLGGAVNIISNNPQFDGYSASGTLEVGSYSLLHTEAMINAPISDTLALRSAFYTENRDGYLSSGQDDSDVKSARFKLLYRPNEKIQILLTADTTRIGGQGQGSVAKPAELRSVDLDDLDDPWDNPSVTITSVSYAKSDRFNIKLDYDFKFAALNYQFSKSDFEGKLDYDFWGELQLDTRTIDASSHQLLLKSLEDSKLIWTAGLFYFEKDAPLRFEVKGVFTNTAPYDETITQAAFFHGTYPIQDWLRFTLGGRYSKVEKNIASGNIEGLPSFVLGIFEGNMKDDTFTYKVGLEADVSEASLLYAMISTGYRSGGLMPLNSGGLLPYGSQELINYQLGSKNRFLNNRLQINGELFYYDYQSYQISYGEYIADTDWRETKISDSSDANIYGGEVEIDYLITRNDRVDGAISYLQTDVGTLPGDMAIYSNYPSDHAPEWTGYIAYQHNFALSNGGDITARADMRFESSYWCNYKQTEGSQQPAYHTSNIRLSYESPDSQFSLAFYVHNIENYPIMTNYKSARASTSPDYYNVQAPRTFGAMVTFRIF